MLFLLFIYAILMLSAYLAYKANLIQDKAPPIIGYTVPFIGHMHMFLSGDAAHMLVSLELMINEILRRGGGVSRVMLGTKSLYLITDPEDCLTVANTCLSKPSMPYGFLNTYGGSGLFTVLDAHRWKPCRKVLNPAFNQHMLDEFLHVFNDEARGLVKKLNKHVGAGPFDQMAYATDFTLENVVRTALDISEEDSDIKNVIIENSRRLLELAAIRITNIWLYNDFVYRLTALGREERKRCDHLNRVTEELVNKKKIQLRKGLSTSKATETKFKPFLNILLDLVDGGVFTWKDLMDQIHTIIATGFHSTATALSFILCAIGTYSKDQDRIYAELSEVFGTSDRDVEKRDLPNLVYLEAFIKETLRLYPVGPIISRHGDTAVKLKEYNIPKNSYYFLFLNATNRLHMWGEDREVFKPERWLDPASIPENPNAFASFSMGRRGCIGRTYAMNLLKVACVHLLRQFKVKSNINKIQLRLDFIYSLHDGHEISIENRL